MENRWLKTHLSILIRDEGTCASNTSIHCNDCPLHEKCRKDVLNGRTMDEIRSKRAEAAKKMLSDMAIEEILLS